MCVCRREWNAGRKPAKQISVKTFGGRVKSNLRVRIRRLVFLVLELLGIIGVALCWKGFGCDRIFPKLPARPSLTFSERRRKKLGAWPVDSHETERPQTSH
jgi:hypothetical protein